MVLPRKLFKGVRNRHRSLTGLTLIEILLAMIVLLIGVMGVLALFPTALEDTGKSQRDTTAALMADSIKRGLTTAMNLAVAGTGTGEYTCTFTHDLTDGTNRILYKFKLPLLFKPDGTAEDWKHHPGTGNPSPGTTTSEVDIPESRIAPSSYTIFKLAEDAWVKARVKRVSDDNDPTVPYAQYAFAFDIKKIDTIPWITDKNERERAVKLYEFRLRIFRVYADTTSGSGMGSEVKELQATLQDRISVR